jgi:hypothetical protein
MLLPLFLLPSFLPTTALYPSSQSAESSAVGLGVPRTASDICRHSTDDLQGHEGSNGCSLPLHLLRGTRRRLCVSGTRQQVNECAATCALYDINQTNHLFSSLFNLFFSTLSVSNLAALLEDRPPGAVGLIDYDLVQQHPLQPHDIRASETARRDEGEKKQAGVSVGYLTQGRLLRSLWQLLSCVLGSDGGCWSHSDAALKVLRCTVLYCTV